MDIYLADWGRFISRYPSLLERPYPYILRTVSDLVVRLPRDYSGARMSLPRVRQGKNLEGLLKREILRPHRAGQKLIVDSGAYSFLIHSGLADLGLHRAVKFTPARCALQNAFRAWMADPVRMRLYVDVYIHEVVPLLREVAHMFVEVDISSVVGDKTSEVWRSQILNQGYGDKFILVCHADTLAEARAHLDRMEDWPSRYTAWPTGAGDDLARWALEAADRGIRTHGFAVSSPVELYRAPYTTTDSTRWSAPIVWGRFDKWHPLRRELEVVPLSSKSAVWDRWVEEHGMSPAEYLKMPLSRDQEVRDGILQAQLHEYAKMAEDVSSYWKGRGYA